VVAPVTRNRGRRLMGEINVVPYIDVMLVLLIIFMVTAPMLSAGIQVDLPKAAAEPLPPDLEPLVLSIDAEGAMYLNIGDAKTPQDADRVLEVVSAALRREPGRPVLVKADRAVEYGRVVEGMALLQQAGAQKVGFATESPSNAPRKSGNR
jgi:biopolymer transport protein TolR